MTVGQVDYQQQAKEMELKRKCDEKATNESNARKMKAVQKEKQVNEQRRKLQASGAAREGSLCDVDALAERDPAIVHGQMRGKYAMK